MDTAIAVFFDGLTFSSYLFIVSLGLTIIFGVMKVLNLAHGGFYAWGAYAAAFCIGRAAAAGWPDWAGFAIIFGAALVVGIVMGLAIELGILRFMHHRDEALVVLATFGILLMLEDAIMAVFGTDAFFAHQPMTYLGHVELGGIARDVYGLTMIALAFVVAVVVWLAFKRTRYGKLLSAVIYDREMALALGINVRKMFLATFVVGAVLGALGGAYVAPTTSVVPGLGMEVIVMSFAVVVIGGMGSIPGALVGALIVGLARALAVHKFPELELFVIYVVMALVLIFRREGLFAPAKVRRI
jgi:branched-chain amino acid transport system permease protein